MSKCSAAVALLNFVIYFCSHLLWQCEDASFGVAVKLVNSDCCVMWAMWSAEERGQRRQGFCQYSGPWNPPAWQKCSLWRKMRVLCARLVGVGLCICSLAWRSGLPSPYAGSPLLSVWHPERGGPARLQPTDTWAEAGRGSLPHTACTFTQNTRKSQAFPWQGYKRKKMGLQGGQLSADSTFPPLCYSPGSLLNQGLAVCLFGW